MFNISQFGFKYNCMGNNVVWDTGGMSGEKGLGRWSEPQKISGIKNEKYCSNNYKQELPKMFR